MASENPPKKPVPANDRIAEQRSAIAVDPEPASDAADKQPDDQAAEKPLAEQVQEVVDDAKALVGTEIAFYRAKINANIDATKKILAYFGLGVAILTAGLTALIYGALITLAPYIGPGGATIVIAGGAIFLGIALIMASVRRAKKMPLNGEKR